MDQALSSTCRVLHFAADFYPSRVASLTLLPRSHCVRSSSFAQALPSPREAAAVHTCTAPLLLKKRHLLNFPGPSALTREFGTDESLPKAAGPCRDAGGRKCSETLGSEAQEGGKHSVSFQAPRHALLSACEIHRRRTLRR
eukprot:scaffold3457_cov230-Pinguiococcus_pyrenoidosus.AAC.6